MAAPTNAAHVKKALANSEPSTHGTKLPIWNVRYPVAVGCRADIVGPEDVNPANSPWMWGCELIASVAGFHRSKVTNQPASTLSP